MQFNAEGIESTPGYRFFDKYEGLLSGVGVDEAAKKLVAEGIDTVIFVDPLRAIEYDPGESAARRSAYRAMGMDTAAGFGLLGDMADEANLILLSQNLFEIDPVAIPQTKVLGTTFDGKIVHDVLYNIGDSNLVDLEEVGAGATGPCAHDVKAEK